MSRLDQDEEIAVVAQAHRATELGRRDQVRGVVFHFLHFHVARRDEALDLFLGSNEPMNPGDPNPLTNRQAPLPDRRDQGRHARRGPLPRVKQGFPSAVFRDDSDRALFEFRHEGRPVG
jgi:hypothetical protein